MTIKFSIRHNYKGMTVEISVEAPNTHLLGRLLKESIDWLGKSHDLIDKAYKIMRANEKNDRTLSPPQT